MRGWNILVLAALDSPSPIPGEALMYYFPSAFIVTYQEALRPLNGAQDTVNVAAIINQIYAAFRLWLLLERKLSMAAQEESLKAVTSVPAVVTNARANMIWNELWPPYQNLVTLYAPEGFNSVSPLAVFARSATNNSSNSR